MSCCAGEAGAGGQSQAGGAVAAGEEAGKPKAREKKPRNPPPAGAEGGDAAAAAREKGGEGKPKAGRASGLRWEDIGAEKPASGTQITSAQLAEALKLKVAFTKEEVDDFKLPNLFYDCYIQVDIIYVYTYVHTYT